MKEKSLAGSSVGTGAQAGESAARRCRRARPAGLGRRRSTRRRRTATQQVSEIPASGAAAKAPARQTEPAVDAVLEEVGPDYPVRGHTTLRVADEPERLDVLLAELVEHEIDDVLQVLVVGCRPDARRRVRRGDDQSVLVLVVHDREVVPLPVAIRAAAVKAQHERHLFAAFQVARVVEKELAAGLRFNCGPLLDDRRPRAITVRTVERRRCFAGDTGDPYRWRGRRAFGIRDDHDRQDDQPRRDSSRLHASDYRPGTIRRNQQSEEWMKSW